MNNLRALIKSLFSEVCPFEELLKLKFESNNINSQKDSFNNIKWLEDLKNYSDTEVENLQKKYREDWSLLPNKNLCLPNSKYNTLVHFTKQVLIEENNEPYVVYYNLLKWKDLSNNLGEDILTNSFFAYNDLKSHKKRHFFSWKPFLFTDNKRLQSILSQGIAENHSHLYASSLNFDISWISLMNNFSKLKNTLEKFTNKNRRHKKYVTQFNYETTNFSELIEKAVAMRILIYYSIKYFNKNDNKPSLVKFLEEKLNFSLSNYFYENENNIEVKIINNLITNEVNYLKNFESFKFVNLDSDCFDYLIPKNVTKKNLDGLFYLYGERKLLYDSFKEVYSESNIDNENIVFFEKIFYIYLLIKNDFRKELIQLNGRYGFTNFKGYQDDKLLFINNSKISRIYLKAYLDISFNLNPRLMNVQSNEFRIAPSKTVNEYIRNIKSYNSLHSSKGYINKKNNKLKIKNKKNDTFYVIHFLKRSDKILVTNDDINIGNQIKCRHSFLRKDLRKQAFDLIKLRENHPEIANKIKGIDAASSEFSARPEVYGQTFRYLKHHHLKESLHFFKEYQSNKLRITFHAGEDFYDLIDGLRYIDESIKFLGMSDGDRIGHGLALGVDVDYYYNLKNNILLLPKQVLFDNIVWIINKTKKFGIIDKHISEIRKLESLFNALSSEIYINPILNKYSNDTNLSKNLLVFNNINYTYQLFYDSWKLRGDDPNIYEEFFITDKKINVDDLTFWDRCAINSLNHKYDLLRLRKEVCFLYYEYHFNLELRNIGEEIKQFKISTGYINLVKEIQNCMLYEVTKRNIGIECNPTSNHLIGTVDKYIQHPIFKFNSKGLNINIDSPLISTSVNTDDAGIFHTSLENEYALLAIALEKEKDEFGNSIHKPSEIYEWIDSIRKMGLQQSFKN